MAESSRDELAKLEALYANNPEGRVFTHLAEAYRKAGELDRARSILEDGLTKHAGYASAHVVLGRVLLDQQKSEEAADAFRRVLSLDPHNHVALRSLGDIARNAGRSDEALLHFQELQHLDPGNEDIQQIIADLTTSIQQAPAPEAEPVVEQDITEPAAEVTTPEAEAFAPLDPDPLPASAELATEPDFGTVDLGSDLDMGWIPDADAPQLPGDLAGFAGFEAETNGALPTFEGVDPLAELTSSFGMPTAEPEVEPEPETVEDLGEPLPFENFSFDEEPASAEPDAAPLFADSAPGDGYAPADTADLTFETETAAEAEASPPSETAPVAEAWHEAQAESATEPQPAAEADEQPVAEAEEQPVAEAEAQPVAEAEAPEPTGQVLTETIAELYRSQGLFDRSAEVYRALLQQRPQDVALSEKLQEVEAQAAAPSPREEPETVGSTSYVDDDAEAWLAGAGATTDSAPTPYAWAENPPARDTDEGPAISEYFGRLLSWRPVAGPAPVETESAAPVEPVEAPELPQPTPEYDDGLSEVEMEPDTMLLLDEEVVSDPVGTAGFYDVQEPPTEPPAADPWLAAEPPAIQEPWEAPAPSASNAPATPPLEPAPSAPPPAASPISSADNPGDAFDEWFGAPEPPPPPAPPAPAPSAEEASASDDDDDDLEMFRSWLQSLKK